MFGGNGGISPSTLYGANFGKNLNGAVVNTYTAYAAAVAQLRTPAGHSGTGPYLNFSAYEVGLAATDPTKPTGNSILSQARPHPARRSTSARPYPQQRLLITLIVLGG